MIRIPTGELVGALKDVLPFVYRRNDLPEIGCVRLEWDGQVLHTLATDRVRIAWSRWDPDTADHDLFTDWGGADEPWYATISRDDAKELVDIYKLPVKAARTTPLGLEANQRQVKVSRSDDSGHSEVTTIVPDMFVMFPDVRSMLARADQPQPVAAQSYMPEALADFAKVRPWAPMRMQFTSGGLTLVHIGKRFTGAIAPVREDDDRDQTTIREQEASR